MISQNENKGIISVMSGSLCGLVSHIALFLLALIILNFTSISIAKEMPRKTIPFQPGEKLTYNGTWGKIQAGELRLEVLPKTNIGGVEAYHFVMVTKTNSRVDLIYKIRERQDSYVDTGMTHSIFYKKNTISKHPRAVSIDYDWKKNEATYSNFGRKIKPISILPGTFDPLALFYIIRCQNLIENSEIYIPLTDGKQNIKIRAIVGRRSLVKVAGKTYNVIEISPDVKMFDKLKSFTAQGERSQLKLWVTDDERRIPIKIRSKVGIISFDFDLVPGLSSLR